MNDDRQIAAKISGTPFLNSEVTQSPNFYTMQMNHRHVTF